MEKSYNLTKQVSTFSICFIILSALAILLQRSVRFTLSVLRAVWRWIVTKHNFTPGDEDPVILTGAQYLGFAMLCFVVVFVLSIQF